MAQREASIGLASPSLLESFCDSCGVTFMVTLVLRVIFTLPSPANASRLSNAGLMLAHRLRRWPNIKPALGNMSPAHTRR